MARLCLPSKWRCRRCGLIVDNEKWLAFQLGKALGILHPHEWEPVEYECE